jgi:hypothetical protein
MTNPYQQPPAESMTFGQAVRAIAERTAFRTEEEATQVFTAVDERIGEEEATAAAKAKREKSKTE